MSLSAYLPGDPAPLFVAASTGRPDYGFSSVGGRYVVLLFLGSAATAETQAALALVQANRGLFDDAKLSFFGVSIDPQDEAEGRLRQSLPGIRHFWDFNRAISRAYGAQHATDAGRYRRYWLVLDPALRTLFTANLAEGESVMRRLRALPAVADHAGAELVAPVLIAPRIFEPDFCVRLIDEYKNVGGRDSGFMREVNGQTVGVFDYQFKRRDDCQIENQELLSGARQRIERRLLPEISKAFQFRVTRMERYIVAHYDGAYGGFFNPHRDNTTKGTAHRRFAVTINLNAEEYEGGDLRFPEFGPRLYRAPTGGAVVFSCSLLHEALPVARGERYAFLPFLYDDAAAQLREQNLRFLANKD